MNNVLFIARTFRLMRDHNPKKLILIFLLTFFQGISGGFSIILLIPMLQLLNVGNGGASDGLALFFQNLSSWFGITLSIELILGIFVGILAFNACLQYWKTILDAGYQQNFIYKLRSRLFRKIILADWSLLNSKSKHNHLQVLTKEVPSLAQYYYYYIRLITQGLIVVAHLFYAFMVSFSFTLMVIITGFLIFIFLRKYLFRSFKLGSDYVGSYYDLIKYIDDFWQSVKIAKVHSSESFYFGKYDKASNSLLDLEYKLAKNYAWPQLLYRLTGIIILSLVVYIGYSLGNVPLTSFFILILLFARIFPQFTGINTDINMIFSNLPSVKLVMDLDKQFAEQEFSVLPFGGTSVSMREGIAMINLSFSYPDAPLLFDNFSETIPAYGITGIVGESGLGKTTLIDLIAGLQSPHSGAITVDGLRLEGEILTSWKNSIGYLPQDAFFIDGTLRDNLVWDSRETITDADVFSVLEQVNAVHLLKRFPEGLDVSIANYLYTFSGGECQRLALARVLLRRPQLLLLDEATSSLDADNEQIIMEVLTQLKKRVTIVFVTHRMSLLPYFDKVIKLI